VFKSLNLDPDGTFSEREFERHLQKTAPWLLHHARGMYDVACRRAHKRDALSDTRGLDFHDVLAVVFPTATDKEVDALLDKATHVPHHESIDFPLQALEREAHRVFQSWNTSQNGRLTREECEAGMLCARIPAEEILDSLEELYDNHQSQDIGVEEFTGWLTDVNNVVGDEPVDVSDD